MGEIIYDVCMAIVNIMGLLWEYLGQFWGCYIRQVVYPSCTFKERENGDV